MTTTRQSLLLLDRAVLFAMRSMVASIKGSVTEREASSHSCVTVQEAAGVAQMLAWDWAYRPRPARMSAVRDLALT